LRKGRSSRWGTATATATAATAVVRVGDLKIAVVIHDDGFVIGIINDFTPTDTVNVTAASRTERKCV
jgi:hypothetical protein